MRQLIKAQLYRTNILLTFSFPIFILILMITMLWIISPMYFANSYVQGMGPYQIIDYVTSLISNIQLHAGAFIIFGIFYTYKVQSQDFDRNKQYQHYLLSGVSRETFFLTKYLIILTTLAVILLLNLLIISLAFIIRYATSDIENPMFFIRNFLSYWSDLLFMYLRLLFIFSAIFSLAFALGVLLAPSKAFIGVIVVILATYLVFPIFLDTRFGIITYNIFDLRALLEGEITFIEDNITGINIHRGFNNEVNWSLFINMHIIMIGIPMILSCLKFKYLDI